MQSTSMFQDAGGQDRIARIGFLDSLFKSALYNDTAHVRVIKNINENQKYTAWANDGIGLCINDKKKEMTDKDLMGLNLPASYLMLFRSCTHTKYKLFAKETIVMGPMASSILSQSLHMLR